MEPNENSDPWEQQSIEGVTGQPRVPDWTMLSPFGVVTFGAGRQPVERLLALQGVIARGVDFITSTPWPAISAAGTTGLTIARDIARRCLAVWPSKPFTDQLP